MKLGSIQVHVYFIEKTHFRNETNIMLNETWSKSLFNFSAVISEITIRQNLCRYLSNLGWVLKGRSLNSTLLVHATMNG